MRYRYPRFQYKNQWTSEENKMGFENSIDLITESVKKNKKFSVSEETEEKSNKLSVPFEGRQLFTRWRWSYPNPTELKSKTFYIQYEKKLSTVDKILLNNFQQKYLYHAIDDILYSLKSKPTERDNLLSILYSPVLSLQNNFSIDFFDIWIDEISINEASKVNKFLDTKNQKVETASSITLRLLYTNKFLTKKTEPLW
jgi:hypothetical protein